MSDYVPIACIEHEKLEFAVLRRQTLRLIFVTESGARESCIVRPTDVGTREGAEWLNYCTLEGKDGVVRLDRILSASPLV
jgi:Rho-binding antiterminator